MALSSLKGVMKIFGGGEPTPEEQAQLLKEVMLMTLARATSADSNIKEIEVERVQEVLKERTGEEFPAPDIRVAAQSAIFERAPLDKYLSASGKKLEWQDRLAIAEALVDVIKSDDRVNEMEIDFFNSVADALEITPAQLMGLHS
jgi:uncharacterized tellurite resistance protein B-like protein